MSINNIKKRIYKASESKAFWSNVSFILLLLAYVVVEGFEVSIWFLAAVVLMFSISSLVYIVTYSVIDKTKPNISAAIIALLVICLSFAFYYYDQVNLIKFSYVFGLVFGVGIMLIYGVAALLDKIRS